MLSEKEQITEFIKCKYDGYHFITNYCKTINNENGEVNNFPNYPYLHKLFKELETGKNIARKKSRRLIISWFIMAYEVWKLTYADNWQGFNLSYKESLVDDHTPNSLHGKAKFIYDNLPDYLKIKIEFPYMKITASNGNYVIGESSNVDAGRGGSFNFGFIDEAAFIRFGETIYAAFSRACKQKVMVSTANGKDTMFYRICKLAQEDTTAGWTYEFLHARLRPDRTEDYFIQAKKEMTALQYAREIDGDDTSSKAGVVWQEFVYEKHVIPFADNPNIPIELTFDFGFADPTAIKFIVPNEDCGTVIEEIEINRSTPEQVVNVIVDKLISLNRLKSFEQSNCSLLEYKNYVKAELSKINCYGDPAGNNAAQDGNPSLIAQYSTFGVKIKTLSRSNVQLGILEVAKRFNKNKLYISENCVKTIDEIQSCHYKVNERTGEILDSQKYEHDEYSHGADALRYWCENHALQEKKISVIKYKQEMTNEREYFKSGRR